MGCGERRPSTRLQARLAERCPPANQINTPLANAESDGAAVAQLAERRPGKAEVPGSNPGGGSTLPSPFTTYHL